MKRRRGILAADAVVVSVGADGAIGSKCLPWSRLLFLGLIYIISIAVLPAIMSGMLWL